MKIIIIIIIIILYFLVLIIKTDMMFCYVVFVLFFIWNKIDK